MSDLSSECTGSASSSTTSGSSGPTEVESRSIRYCARKILERGAMSMCTPPRRDCDLVTEMSFEKGKVNLTWPPVNWKGLSGD